MPPTENYTNQQNTTQPMSTDMVKSSGGGMMASIAAVLILIVGAGGLYFAFNKDNSSDSETSANQVSGFAFNNDDNVAPVNKNTSNNGTTANISNEETTQPVVESTPSAGSTTFKCEDLFPAADMQKFTKDSSPVTVVQEESGDDINCEYQQRVNDDPNDLTHAYAVDINLPYLTVTTANIFEGYKNNTSSLENIPNIGTGAFTGVLGGVLRPVIVLSTNQKYVFWVSSTWDTGTPKTDKNYLKEIAKIINANLSKY